MTWEARDEEVVAGNVLRRLLPRDRRRAPRRTMPDMWFYIGDPDRKIKSTGIARRIARVRDGSRRSVSANYATFLPGLQE